MSIGTITVAAESPASPVPTPAATADTIYQNNSINQPSVSNDPLHIDYPLQRAGETTVLNVW